MDVGCGMLDVGCWMWDCGLRIVEFRLRIEDWGIGMFAVGKRVCSVFETKKKSLAAQQFNYRKYQATACGAWSF